MKVIKKEPTKTNHSKNIIELPEEVSIELNDRTIVLEKGERIEVMSKVEERTILSKDQFLFSIRQRGEVMGYIEIEQGKIVTTGQIGENTYENFVDLIKGLQGFDISIDDFYW